MMQNSSLMETSCNERLDENDDCGKHGDIQIAVPSEKTKTVKKQYGRGEDRTARAIRIIRMMFLVIK